MSYYIVGDMAEYLGGQKSAMLMGMTAGGIYPVTHVSDCGEYLAFRGKVAAAIHKRFFKHSKTTQPTKTTARRRIDKLQMQIDANRIEIDRLLGVA